MKEKEILITGSAGFIGRNICSEALRLGYKVTGFDLKETKIDGVNSVIGDIRNKEQIDKVVKNKDFVIHTAAVTSVIEFEKNLFDSYSTNVTGFMNLIDSAAKSNVSKFLYASSSAIYLDNFSEETVIDIRKLKNDYSKSKLMNELIAESYSSLYSMKTIGMRFFNVYGVGENEKGNYASIISIFLKNKKENKPLILYGDGKQARDFIYVEDLAKIVFMLLDKAENGIYNVGTGKAIEYNYIADLIEKNNKKYVENPLKTYQYLTKADTKKLFNTIGQYKFKTVEDFIKYSITNWKMNLDILRRQKNAKALLYHYLE